MLESVSAQIAGKTLIVYCDTAAVPHAKAFLARITRESELRDNARLPLGFAHLVLRQAGDALVAHEPNYAGNPVIALRRDATTTLALAADMLAVAHARGVEPQFPHFMDTVLVSPGWAHAPSLRMQRRGAWRLAPDGASPDHTIRAYELLAARPMLLTAMALPDGTDLKVERDRFFDSSHI